jgi:CheY-like chemotaxis protein
MSQGKGVSMNTEDYAALTAHLVHEVSTPMAIARINLEIIARYLPQLVSVYEQHRATLPEAEQIAAEYLDALRNAPALIEQQCQTVDERVKSHWRAAKSQRVVPGREMEEVRPLSPQIDSIQIKPVEGLQILVVEDEEIHRDIALKVLSESHYVEVAGSGREALQRCQARPFELVLLDLRLPDLDGRQLAKLIRRAHHKGPYIAALSNYPAAEDELRQEGFDGQLEKPLKAETFRRFLQQEWPQWQRES